LSDQVGVATRAKKQSVRGFIPASDHAQAAKSCMDSSISQLDFPPDIVDNLMIDARISDLIRSY
jgi:hypothetical protein